jgi:aryl-alcohol dehydrogenase-like predicted oxidoreductase
VAAVSPTFVLGGNLTVHRLGLGAMSITGPGVWGEPRDGDAARRLLRRAVELGIDFVDTADSYGPEVSERLIAEALHPYPENFVLATKAGLTRQGPGRWSPDCRPEHLRAACEGSLERLRLERIPLFQLHTVDPSVPIEESLGALLELRHEGKIEHIGVCNVSAPQLDRALAVAPVVSVQNRFSLAEQSAREVLDRCERHGLGFISWAPLAKGVLAEGRGRLTTVATRHGATPSQVALAWLLQRSAALLAIPGTSSVAHLEENARAADIALEPSEVTGLEAILFPAYKTKKLLRRSRVAVGAVRDAFRGGST